MPGNDTGWSFAGCQGGVPGGAARQGGAGLAQTDGLQVALLGYAFGFIGAAFIEQVVSAAAAGTGQ
ncbi:hypothetical protein [Mycolicibacter arupensis]|uniref:hypothetical protein n=1 Tax=Mycolicibacter arupensis TaxID=342002 RepID=UPI0012FEAFB7|nr:hypothetical protein [Mycolicibacter arupensis]MCV7274134.1 hypothetical protein [Mycolicibacter arupensis]